ncbi:MAG TPA: hypothetical protein GXX72_05020 [Clostridiaceae bacterium]|nr:hypothetical protein [Clostridiaceae bacterium]
MAERHTGRHVEGHMLQVNLSLDKAGQLLTESTADIDMALTLYRTLIRAMDSVMQKLRLLSWIVSDMQTHDLTTTVNTCTRDGMPTAIRFQENDGTVRRIVFEEGDRDVGLPPCWRPDDSAWENMKKQTLTDSLRAAIRWHADQAGQCYKELCGNLTEEADEC